MNKDAGLIILLNGVGSAGKSSLARAMQRLATRSLLHVQMDAFLEMLPARYADDPHTFAYCEVEMEGGPGVAIETGPAGKRLSAGMRSAVAALAAAGNDVIFDDVMTEADKVAALAPFNGARLFKVCVFAPLAVLEAREIARGDRRIGLARWQVDRVHQGMDYDLTIDTSRVTPEEGAQLICRQLNL